jgi:2-polyprenyl-3-methyl-5-hydroxy-6-metoxy-1,4-benzoquinol methylase
MAISRTTDVEMQTRGTNMQSFRDPAGQVVMTDQRVFRIVGETGLADLRDFLNSGTARRFLESGGLVQTRFLNSEEISQFNGAGTRRLNLNSAKAAVVEHEKVSFRSYPFEWPPEMLYEAGCLTLDLAESLLDEGLGIKDATPYNILYRGPVPVFVDLLSFERRKPGAPVWVPYSQFVRTFLLPLLVNKYFGLQLDQLLVSRRDGLEPENVYRLCGMLKKLNPVFLELVSVPKWLAAKHDGDNTSVYQQKTLDDPEKARFILRSLFKRLRRLLNSVKPERGKESKWSNYLTSNNNYSTEHFAAKQQFIEDALAEFSPRRVLDVGCNTGHFSIIAAQKGAEVVAIDYDPIVIGELWRRCTAEKINVLSLVVNLVRPTPGIGWRNQECASFLDRSRGKFDAVMMLALIHHLLVSERIPLEEIIDLAADLTTDLLIIEYVDPGDSMFRRLVRGRESLHTDLTVEKFESVCQAQFDIVRTQHLNEESRWLYFMRKRNG